MVNPKYGPMKFDGRQSNALRRAGREIERLLRESTEEGVKTALLGLAFALVGINDDGETVLSRVLKGSASYFRFSSREDVLDGV